MKCDNCTKPASWAFVRPRVVKLRCEAHCGPKSWVVRSQLYDKLSLDELQTWLVHQE